MTMNLEMHGIKVDGLPWRWVLAKSRQLEKDLLERRLQSQQNRARAKRISLTR